MKINIDGKHIGDSEPTFVTFEAGPTHNGFDSAKELIKLSHEAGADAVKFQIFDPDELISDKNLLYSYDVLLDKISGLTETIEEPLYDIFTRRSLSSEQWKLLKSYADSLGITFFATIGDNLGLEIVKEIGCQSIKIASADVNHIPWLRTLSKLDISIQLDTGNATLGEIENAVDVLQSEGNKQIIIHNCPSGYPARLESINLRMIPVLKAMFNCPIAYSDHTPGEIMDIAAIAMGANLVEKTITVDRTTRSVEHIMSLEPVEMNSFIKNIRDVELAMGSSRRIMSEKEKQNRMKVRRSVVLDQSALAGDKLEDLSFKYKRPEIGIPPDLLEKFINRRLKSNLSAGHIIKFEDLE